MSAAHASALASPAREANEAPPTPQVSDHLPAPDPTHPQGRSGWARAANLIVWVFIVAVVAVVGAGAIVPRVLGAVPLTVLTGSMRPGIEPGDLIVVEPVTSANDVQVGDVITFQPISNDPMLITHRVVDVERDGAGTVVGLTTRGDANGADDKPIVPGQVQGTLLYSIPKLGFVASAIDGGARTWIVMAAIAGLFAYAVWSWSSAAREAWKSRRRA